MKKPIEWWKGAVIYQIYPRSFQDSNNDGVGDIRGIINRLDYLEWLGVDALWLSPVFTSPMKDFGYDISDYRDIDPLFGNLEDFKLLVKSAHEKDIRVIIDQVYNHTSDQHEWFKTSRESRDNPKADWYVWVDGKKGELPNNWLSYFGGPAWEWDEKRQQYYLHLFVKEQPDLNWRNQEVQDEIMDTMRFWLDLGVDGFRFDVVNMFFKDDRLRNDPRIEGENSNVDYRNYYRVFENDRPETLLAIERMNDVISEYNDILTIGEVGSPMGTPAYFEYTKPGRLDLAFNFEFKEIDELKASTYRDKIKETERIFKNISWPSYVLGNHDSPRFPQMYRDNKHKTRITKLLATMLLTLRGTPFIYYGEEIGMDEVEIPYDRIVDPAGKYYWPNWKGRDGARTPMQWDSSEHASFSETEPWLPLSDDYKENNVNTQKDDKRSILNYYRKLIRIRKNSEDIKWGTLKLIESDNNSLLIYKRQYEEDIIVLLNFSSEKTPLDRELVSGYRPLLSNMEKSDLKLIDYMGPYEARIMKKN